MAGFLKMAFGGIRGLKAQSLGGSSLRPGAIVVAHAWLPGNQGQIISPYEGIAHCWLLGGGGGGTVGSTAGGSGGGGACYGIIPVRAGEFIYYQSGADANPGSPGNDTWVRSERGGFIRAFGGKLSSGSIGGEGGRSEGGLRNFNGGRGGNGNSGFSGSNGVAGNINGGDGGDASGSYGPTGPGQGGGAANPGYPEGYFSTLFPSGAGYNGVTSGGGNTGYAYGGGVGGGGSPATKAKGGVLLIIIEGLA